jgi:hypothetical protein
MEVLNLLGFNLLMVRGIFTQTLDLFFQKRGRWKGEREEGKGDGVSRGLHGDVSSYMSQVDPVSFYVR